jgi:uncharacterized ferritin-like protein (DUF455 family)
VPSPELRQAALHWLAEPDVAGKVAGVRDLARRWESGEVGLEIEASLDTHLPLPGQPDRPVRVSPREVPRRAMNTLQGRAAMVHAMAHIEFNAINLALDAMWRFPNLPRAYYADWLQVADEEALHFELLAAHLKTLGHAYGDFPAHNGLWDLAEQTRHDVLARMALLPRTMEARGLDVTPGMKAKLVQAGDAAVGPIMDVILRDEVGHVAIGNRWFGYLCRQRGLVPEHTYARLLAEHHVAPPRAPINLAARRAAGFSEQELSGMSANAAER